MRYQTTLSDGVVKNPFSTAGLAPAANALDAHIGSYVNTAFPWSGDMSVIAFAQSSISDSQTAALGTALQDAYVTGAQSNIPFPWGNNPRSSTTISPVITGLVTHLLAMPNGQTPLITDLNTHQYHHHTRIAAHSLAGGGVRRWLAFTSNQNIETDVGMGVVVTSSADGFATSTALQWGMQNQSDWGNTAVSTSRGVTPRNFVEYLGSLYLTLEITSPFTGSGLVLAAVKCNDDGTVGTPFLISTQSYTANSGYPQYVYDPVLGPPLYASSNVYGQYDDGSPNDPWHGITNQGGVNYCERGAIPLDTSGKNIAFIWRVCGGNGGSYSFVTTTTDGDATETPITLAGQSRIPAGGSPVSGALLADGRLVTVGNPFPSRFSQYIAVWSDMTHPPQSLRATVQQNSIPQYAPNSSTNVACSATFNPAFPENNCVALTPWYPATGKAGGCSYPGIWIDSVENLLLISCSIDKESIIEMEIPLGNL
jgi:hypothetical protein